MHHRIFHRRSFVVEVFIASSRAWRCSQTFCDREQAVWLHTCVMHWERYSWREAPPRREAPDNFPESSLSLLYPKPQSPVPPFSSAPEESPEILPKSWCEKFPGTVLPGSWRETKMSPSAWWFVFAFRCQNCELPRQLLDNCLVLYMHIYVYVCVAACCSVLYLFLFCFAMPVSCGVLQWSWVLESYLWHYSHTWVNLTYAWIVAHIWMSHVILYKSWVDLIYIYT